MARSRMRTTQYDTWRRSSTTNMVPHTLAKLTSQRPTIKLNLTEKKDICTIDTSQDVPTVQDVPTTSGIEKTPLQSSRIASTQHSKESKVLCSFKTMCWSMEVPWSSLTRECLQSRVDYYMRKTSLLMRNLTKNKSIALIFLEYSISKEGIARDPKHVENKKCKSIN